ncbi:DUF2059 domain-containing protein [Herbaspirillum huttiense F1]|uniref:DUF2059 domain-containing protein n=1 Tax=Herbaspirillum huttiense TaxID=863372 RepID=UPI002883A0B4|nr:DUF2059 domain-containing protein [Herbaspirillum huttiense]MDT0359036.1 DUF2059 domain-containing protein [Herbaspirillum huttiense F1]
MMHHRRILLAVALSALAALSAVSAPALAAPASEDTVRQILEVTQSRQLVDGIMDQQAARMDQVMTAVLAGHKPTPAQQQAMDKMKFRMLNLIRESINWEKMEPGLYRETFTEEEVQGMLDFYRTPAGQAMIHKLPVLMQRNMDLMQQSLIAMQPRMQQIQQDFMAEIKAAK